MSPAHKKVEKYMPNLVDTAANAGSFNTLLTAIETAGLLEILNSPGPYTVLAPTDEAFAKIPVNTLSDWLQDIPKLKKILTFHILFGDVRTDNFAELNSAETFEGGIIGIDKADGGFKINDAKVLQTDILADNGVIHTIDTVLMPTLMTV